jgi:hypothetical protein
MSDDWEVIRVTGAMEAEVLRAALETADIPVVVQDNTFSRVVGYGPTPSTTVRVMVPPDRAEEARALLDASTAVDFPLSD